MRLRPGGEDESADFGAVRGIRAAARRARVIAPRSCRDGRFPLRVATRLARRVALRVDGPRIAARRAAGRVRHRFALDARDFARGVHRVEAGVTFLDGSRRVERSTFYRCRPAAPRYTG